MSVTGQDKTNDSETTQAKSWTAPVASSIIIFLIIVSLGAALIRLDNDTNVGFVFLIAISIAASVLIINFPGVLSFRKMSLPVTITAIAAGALLPTLTLLAPHPNLEYLTTFISKDVTHRIIHIIFAWVLFPIIEEIYFRGLLFPITADHIGKSTAAILSVMLFVLYHMQSTHLLGLALQGIIYTSLMYKKDSVLACILAHSVHNSTLLAFALIRA